MNTRILSVGQCGVDEPRIAGALHRTAGAQVDSADTATEALQAAAGREYDLILVNRVLQDGTSGLDLIDDLIGEGINTPVMLVSDMPEAQEQAVSLGAVRGFGKGELGSPSTLELLKRIVTGVA